MPHKFEGEFGPAFEIARMLRGRSLSTPQTPAPTPRPAVPTLARPTISPLLRIPRFERRPSPTGLLQLPPLFPNFEQRLKEIQTRQARPYRTRPPLTAFERGFGPIPTPLLSDLGGLAWAGLTDIGRDVAQFLMFWAKEIEKPATREAALTMARRREGLPAPTLPTPAELITITPEILGRAGGAIFGTREVRPGITRRVRLGRLSGGEEVELPVFFTEQELLQRAADRDAQDIVEQIIPELKIEGRPVQLSEEEKGALISDISSRILSGEFDETPISYAEMLRDIHTSEALSEIGYSLVDPKTYAAAWRDIKAGATMEEIRYRYEDLGKEMAGQIIFDPLWLVPASIWAKFLPVEKGMKFVAKLPALRYVTAWSMRSRILAKVDVLDDALRRVSSMPGEGEEVATYVGRALAGDTEILSRLGKRHTMAIQEFSDMVANGETKLGDKSLAEALQASRRAQYPTREFIKGLEDNLISLFPEATEEAIEKILSKPERWSTFLSINAKASMLGKAGIRIGPAEGLEAYLRITEGLFKENVLGINPAFNFINLFNGIARNALKGHFVVPADWPILWRMSQRFSGRVPMEMRAFTQAAEWEMVIPSRLSSNVAGLIDVLLGGEENIGKLSLSAKLPIPLYGKPEAIGRVIDATFPGISTKAKETLVKMFGDNPPAALSAMRNIASNFNFASLVEWNKVEMFQRTEAILRLQPWMDVVGIRWPQTQKRVATALANELRGLGVSGVDELERTLLSLKKSSEWQAALAEFRGGYQGKFVPPPMPMPEDASQTLRATSEAISNMRGKAPKSDKALASFFENAKKDVETEYARMYLDMGFDDVPEEVFRLASFGAWPESRPLQAFIREHRSAGELMLRKRVAATWRTIQLLGGEEARITPQALTEFFSKLSEELQTEVWRPLKSPHFKLRNELIEEARRLEKQGKLAEAEALRSQYLLDYHNMYDKGFRQQADTFERLAQEDLLARILKKKEPGMLDVSLDEAQGIFKEQMEKVNFEEWQHQQEVISRKNFEVELLSEIETRTREAARISRISRQELNKVFDKMKKLEVAGKTGTREYKRLVRKQSELAGVSGTRPPDDLRGIDLDTIAERHLDDYATSLEEASLEGTLESEAINVNYAYRSDFQEATERYVPFSTWMLGQAKFWLPLMAQKPYIPADIIRFRDAIEWQRNQANLSSRFKLFIPLPGQELLIERGILEPGYWAISTDPFSDVFGQIPALRGEEVFGYKEEEWVGRLWRTPELFGLRVYPWWQMVGEILGAYKSTPATDLLYTTKYLKLTLGIDIEKPLRDWRQGLRGTDAIGEYYTNLRLHWAAYQWYHEGTLLNGEEVTWDRMRQAVNNPEDPLFQAAKAEVANFQFMKSVVRGIVPITLQYMSPSEMLAREGATLKDLIRSEEEFKQFAESEIGRIVRARQDIFLTREELREEIAQQRSFDRWNETKAERYGNIDKSIYSDPEDTRTVSRELFLLGRQGEVTFSEAGGRFSMPGFYADEDEAREDMMSSIGSYFFERIPSRGDFLDLDGRLRREEYDKALDDFYARIKTTNMDFLATPLQEALRRTNEGRDKAGRPVLPAELVTDAIAIMKTRAGFEEYLRRNETIPLAFQREWQEKYLDGAFKQYGECFESGLGSWSRRACTLNARKAWDGIQASSMVEDIMRRHPEWDRSEVERAAVRIGSFGGLDAYWDSNQRHDQIARREIFDDFERDRRAAGFPDSLYPLLDAYFKLPYGTGQRSAALRANPMLKNFFEWYRAYKQTHPAYLQALDSDRWPQGEAGQLNEEPGLYVGKLVPVIQEDTNLTLQGGMRVLEWMLFNPNEYWKLMLAWGSLIPESEEAIEGVFPGIGEIMRELRARPEWNERGSSEFYVAMLTYAESKGMNVEAILARIARIDPGLYAMIKKATEEIVGEERAASFPFRGFGFGRRPPRPPRPRRQAIPWWDREFLSRRFIWGPGVAPRQLPPPGFGGQL